MPKRISTPRCASVPSSLNRRRRITMGCLLLSALWPVFVASGQQPQRAPLIWTCDKPFMFGFGTWEKAWKEPQVGKAGIRVVAASGQGGAGIGVLHRNLEGCGDFTPALTVTATDKHKAKGLFFALTDADGTSHKYQFDLSKLQPGVPQQILALEGASLTEPSAVDKPGTVPGLDLSKIEILIFVGDWSVNPVDLTISAVSAVPPTDEILAQRVKLRERLAREAKAAAERITAQERARQELLTKGANHPQRRPRTKARLRGRRGRAGGRPPSGQAREQRAAALCRAAGGRGRGGAERQSAASRQGRQSGGLLPAGAVPDGGQETDQSRVDLA